MTHLTRSGSRRRTPPRLVFFLLALSSLGSTGCFRIGLPSISFGPPPFSQLAPFQPGSSAPAGFTGDPSGGLAPGNLASATPATATPATGVAPATLPVTGGVATGDPNRPTIPGEGVVPSPLAPQSTGALGGNVNASFS